MVPPHCLTYQRNQRADTSWGSEVTFTLTNRVPNWRAALGTRERRKEVSIAGKITNRKNNVEYGRWNNCGKSNWQDNIILWDSLLNILTLFFFTHFCNGSDQAFLFIRPNLKRHIYLSYSLAVVRLFLHPASIHC